MVWTVAEAKNKFSEIFRLCQSEGPQRVERRDSAAYLISESDFRRLAPDRPSLVDFLSSGPDWIDVQLDRDGETMRDLAL